MVMPGRALCSTAICFLAWNAYIWPGKAPLRRHSDERYVVDIEARTCTCDRFEINDFRCGHEFALNLRLRKQTRNYIPKVFTLETYRWTKMRDMHPVDIQHLQIRALSSSVRAYTW